MNTHATSTSLTLLPSGVPAVLENGGNLRSIEHLAKLLWRKRLFIALCGVLVGAIAYGATKQLPKRYTAEGLIRVDMHRFNVPELEGLIRSENLTDPSPLVRSETLLLQSPNVLRLVAADLDLAKDPEFNVTLRPQSNVDRAKAFIGEFLRGEHLPAFLEDRLKSFGVSFAPTKKEEPDDLATREGILDSLKENLTVFNDGRSLIISVSFTSENPSRAAEVVNRLFERYLGEKREVLTARNREGMAALQERLAEAKAEMEKAELKVRDFRAKNGLVSVRAGSVTQQQVEDLTSALARASEERARIQASYERAVAMASRGSVTADVSDVLSSVTVGNLRQREAEAVRRYTELSSRLGPTHPEMRSADAELKAVRGEIAAEGRRVVAALGAQAQAARQREAEITKQLEQLRKEGTKLGAAQAELLQLEKDSDTRRAMYQSLMQRVEQSAAEPRDPQVLGVQISSYATPPAKPSAPRPGLSAGIGMLLGICIGGFVTVLRGQHHSTIRDIEDLAQETRLPVLVGVPRPSGWADTMSLPKRVVSKPHGGAAEALRGLRAQLRFAAPDAPPRSVAFVASTPGENSAALAVAFARVAALDGLKVLVIEGNLQRPSLCAALELPESDGLIAALTQNAPWTDAVTSDTVTPLDLLLVSRPQSHALQLLESVRFHQLLADVREEYNLVVVNAPAATLTAEAMFLARCVDAMVLVADAETTPRYRVRAAAERLLVTPNTLVAGVLNRAVVKH